MSPQVKDLRLSLETAVIGRLAQTLVTLLQKRDPLSEKVHLSKPEFLALTLRRHRPRFDRPRQGRAGGSRDASEARMSVAEAAPPATAQTRASGSSFYAAMRILPRAQRDGDVRNLFLLPRLSTTSPTMAARRRCAPDVWSNGGGTSMR